MITVLVRPQGTLESVLQDSVNSIGDFTGVFSIWDIAIVLCLSFGLSLIIGKTYQVTHKGISYSQGNVQTYVLMAVVIGALVLKEGYGKVRVSAALLVVGGVLIMNLPA
mgnify:CR=1 FL=1